MGYGVERKGTEANMRGWRASMIDAVVSSIPNTLPRDSLSCRYPTPWPPQQQLGQAQQLERTPLPRRRLLGQRLSPTRSRVSSWISTMVKWLQAEARALLTKLSRRSCMMRVESL
jgi:hypothetical protein